MFGSHFYHEKTRKCVAAFGRLFNNIYVVRNNASGGGYGQTKVPLSYAPKSKYLERIRENPDVLTDSKVAIKLPRMSFEINGITFDSTRQLQKVNSVSGLASSGSNAARSKLYTGVPYILSFQLNIYAKSQDDALQIVEQILPTFSPQYSLTMIPYKNELPDYREDIPITIVGVGFNDDFEGEVGARRTIVYNLDFEMRVSYHGGFSDGEIIRKSTSKLYEMDAGNLIADSDGFVSRVEITPDPTTIIGLADSDFGFTETWYDSAG